MPTNPSTSLTGQAAFVTGGSRGIGAAIVRRLAHDGAAVAFTYQSASAAAEALVHEIEAAGGHAIALRIDSADAAALRAGIDETVRRLGRLDILVNNAGIFAAGTVDQLSIEDFDRTFAVNVRAVFAATQAAAVHLPDGGRVINIGSCNAHRVHTPGFAAYAASKSALIGLVRGLARDLGPRGITVNNVQPGPVDTDMNPADGPQAPEQHAVMALPRHARPQEVAGMVAYLASAEGGFVTGANLLVDGGYSV